MPFILFALCAGALAFDFRKNLRNSPRFEKALYLALMLIAAVLLLLHEYGVNVPSPAKPIEKLIIALVGKQ